MIANPPGKTFPMGKNKAHLPIRTCISCGAKRRKRELTRLTLDAQGKLLRDDCGKGQGRGAYVCMDGLCWESLGRGNRLNRAFRRKVTIPFEDEALR